MTTISTDQAQPQAQLDAQPIHGTDESSPMPIEPNQADLAVVLRVLGRAGISQDRVARDLNISKGHISRYFSGGSPMPFVVIRYLWDRTSDLELLDLLGGRDSRMRLAAMRRDRVPVGVGIDEALPTVVQQLAEATHQLRSGQPRAAAELIETTLCLLNGVFETTCKRALASATPNIVPIGSVRAVASRACRDGRVDLQA